MKTEIILVINKQSFPVIMIKLRHTKTQQIHGEMYENNRLTKSYKTAGHGFNKKQDVLEHFFTGTSANLDQLKKDGYKVVEITDERKHPAQIL